jgi:ABC-2 type transport system permease protein
MIWKLMKKELKEFLKTGKIYVLLFSLLFFGISSPIIAKFTPEIIESLVKNQEMQSLIIQLPPPTWKDAFIQFFKNLNQIVFLIIVLLFIGCISEEKNKNTASIFIALGIDRKKWIFSKFLFQIIITYFFLLISFIACAYYTYFLFSTFPIQNSISAMFLYFIYIFFILSLIIFSSSLGNNFIQSAGIFLGIFIIFNLLSIFPNMDPYNPMSLSSLQNEWILKSVIWEDALKNIIFTLIYSFILLTLGVVSFEKQEL